MSPEQRPPLWKVMREAYEEARMGPPGSDYAAEIRAVRDWLVPEEDDPPVGESEPWPQAYQQRSDAMWEQRQALRALLTAEAERAEGGE